MYRAEVEDGSVTRTTSMKTVFFNGDEATFAVKSEPWILDTAKSLSQVNGYQQITFGNGATLKTEPNDQCQTKTTMVPTMSSTPVAVHNYWFDRDNFSKWCAEGSVTNLLSEILAVNDADN